MMIIVIGAMLLGAVVVAARIKRWLGL